LVSGWLRGDIGDSGRLTIEFKNQEQGVISSTTTNNVVSADWSEFSTTATAPVGTWQISVVLTTSSGNRIEFDDIVLADLSIPVVVPGDANGDLKVDGLDYLVWADHFGDDPAADPPGSPGNGDFNQDGVVSGLDYLVWVGNFGNGPNDAVSVPEPTARMLMFLAACGAILFVRR
jgi:hypothetical protein